MTDGHSTVKEGPEIRVYPSSANFRAIHHLKKLFMYQNFVKNRMMISNLTSDIVWDFGRDLRFKRELLARLDVTEDTLEDVEGVEETSKDARDIEYAPRRFGEDLIPIAPRSSFLVY